MKIVGLDRATTSFNNSFLSDYKNGKFDHLLSFKPQISEVAKVIDYRKTFSKEKRVLLQNTLLSQYQEDGIALDQGSKVLENIEALGNEQAFTITTGQQIHLGLGPMYVLYKILDVVQTCIELRGIHPDQQFVPVFWMASEDHDLEEIETVGLYNKAVKWETKQGGPVGRMSSQGTTDVFENILENFNLSEDQITFLNDAKKAYSQTNLATAFRRLLHTYAESMGLVILNPDSEELKRSFTSVLIDELKGVNYKALKDSTKDLDGLGYKQQLVIRECNLFFISGGERERIVLKSDGVYLKNGHKLCSKEGIEDFVQEHAFNLSPNAALRPFYQETVLPNLMYVGGASEVKYWLQLPGIFRNYKLKMPIIHLRTSVVIIPGSKLKKLRLQDELDLFLPEKELLSRYGQEKSSKQDEIDEAYQQLKDALQNYTKLLEANSEGFSFKGKESKIKDRLEEMHQVSKQRLNLGVGENDLLYKVLKTKNMYLSEDRVQERIENIVAFAAIWGELKPEKLSYFGLRNFFRINLILT
jgi:bacillithiol biosynthesis cysteine-adding enzyme BshC